MLQFGEQFPEILTRELPLEGLRRCFPVVLKIEETFRNGIQIGEIVRGENLALHDREGPQSIADVCTTSGTKRRRRTFM
jgi:hypothetical protein